MFMNQSRSPLACGGTTLLKVVMAESASFCIKVCRGSLAQTVERRKISSCALTCSAYARPCSLPWGEV
jgi:hypothetical protein